MTSETIEDINPEDIEEEQGLFLDCRKVLDAGIWLMRNGYGRMMMLPYAAPSGCYWRCEFHSIGRPSNPFFRYSSGSAWRYLNDHSRKRVRREITPRGLGRAILRNAQPYLVKECVGELSPETDAWLVQLERALSNHWIPQAFDDGWGEQPQSKWKLVGMLGVSDSWIDAPPDYIAP